MRSALTVLVGTLALVACSGSGTSGSTTGLNLEIRYDSTLPVAELRITADDAEGVQVVEPFTREAPTFVEPPGLRRVRFSVSLEGMSSGRTVDVRVAGADADGALIGAGATRVSVMTGVLVEAIVTLNAPLGCGDGSRSGAEQCDDGNLRDGDGCNSDCMLEGAPREVNVVETEVLEARTTTAAEFIDIPGARLEIPGNDRDETWLVFASGLLGSSSLGEKSAEVRILVDGEPSTVFSHQTLGGSDNEAGFVTFDAVRGPVAHVIRAQFRAELGTTTVRSVRLVGAWVPPGADLQFVESDDDVERTGRDLELLALDFTSSRGGPHLVLAATSFSEAPGTDTARVFVRDPRGVNRPEDEKGVTFSAPRSAEVPFFTAFQTELVPGESARFTLRGRSSGDGDLTAWWNDTYAYRRRIVVTAGASEVPVGHPVSVVFDHSSQVLAGRARGDGADVRLVARTQGVLHEVARVVDPSSAFGLSDTRLWFVTDGNIPANGTDDTYWLYFGRADADPPPSDPLSVFTFYDDFSDPLDERWSRTGGTVANGILTLGPAMGLYSAVAFGASTRVDARLRFSEPALAPAIYLGGTDRNEPIDRTGAGFGVSAEGHRIGASGVVASVAVASPEVFHVYAFQRLNGGVTFFQDQDRLAPNEFFPDTGIPLAVYLENEAQTGQLSYDWVRVRRALAEEPRLALNELEGAAGVMPSTFRHKKLAVLRMDAWDASAYAESRQLESTTSTIGEIKGELLLEAPASQAQLFAIMALRIAGEDVDTGRKRGVLRANGQVLLETSHKINRNNTDYTGYHHVAGVVDAWTMQEDLHLENAFASPDGIQVDAAESVIMVLRYPPN